MANSARGRRRHSSSLRSFFLDALEARQLLSVGPIAKVNLRGFYFNDVMASARSGAGTSPPQLLVISNGGDQSLIVRRTALKLVGDNAADFTLTSTKGGKLPATMTLAPGTTRGIRIRFNANTVGIESAAIKFHSNDPRPRPITVTLRGIGTTGLGGNNEPSLQRILDLYQIPVRVGESNPSKTQFTVPPATPNDEVAIQRLLKAGAGNVTIQLLALFDNANTPATRVGVYTPGTPDQKTELFTVPNPNDSQSVNPQVSGNTGFDPKSGPFDLYAVFPAFTNRASYQEDALNTWEPTAANRRKVRFYPLKNPDGTTVANAYVFAFEDWNVSYDFQDVVGIIRNVKPAAPGPNIGIANGDGAPFFDRLVFSRILNTDTIFPNKVHDKSVLTIRNTGQSTLNVTSMVLSDTSRWQIVGGAAPLSIAPGSTQNVTVQFKGNSTGLVRTFTGTLTLNSNDPAHPKTVVQLAGIWQRYSEVVPPGFTYAEPHLAQVMSTLGYQITVANSGQFTDNGQMQLLGGTGMSVAHGGAGNAVGQEILSPYWLRADSNAPVTVRMLDAMHSQHGPDANNPTDASSTLFYYFQGASGALTTLFRHNKFEGQTLLPHLSGSTTAYAMTTFTPSGSTPFGFKVDNRFSDDSLNTQDQATSGRHSWRFYPARDERGNLIPNTYIAAQDYTGHSYSNYDYQDNVYLISNVKPAGGTRSASAVAASGSPAPGIFATTPIGNSAPFDDRLDTLI